MRYYQNYKKKYALTLAPALSYLPGYLIVSFNKKRYICNIKIGYGSIKISKRDMTK